MIRFRLILASLILLIFSQSCNQNQAPELTAASDKYRLVWNTDPAHAVTVVWDQSEKVGNALVYYGEEDFGREYWKYPGKRGAARISRKYDMVTHFAEISGLKSNKNYYFVLKDDEGVSKRYWFKTAPDSPMPFTFIAGGDTKSAGNPLEAGRNSNRVVAKLRPLFVYFNGDFTSGNGTSPEGWATWLNDWQELTTTQDGRMIPVVPIHGNHENGDMANLWHIFNAPYQENDSTQIYYSLSIGGDLFHMIMLNSEIETGGAQKEWLIKDLEKHRNFTFKIAGYHKPFFPHHSGKREHDYQYDQWAGLFNQYGLNISFDADSHMHKITWSVVPDDSDTSVMGFTRDDVNGTMYVGEGSWGAHPRSNDDDKPWTMTSGSFNQIKWIHVIPATADEEAHVKIFTVLTANYDQSDNLISYNQDLESLTEDNLFEVPENIILHKPQPDEDHVRYPVRGSLSQSP